MKAVFDWLLTVGSALSQLAYAVFANSRNSNLSISGEAYFNRNRSRLRYVWYKFINALFFMQPDQRGRSGGPRVLARVNREPAKCATHLWAILTN